MADSPLDIDDKNVGDYGRPFGTYAVLVKSAAKRKLEFEGKKPTLWDIDALYMAHMQSLPSYRTISQRKVVIEDSLNPGNRTLFSEPELRAIFERFAMANDPDSQAICEKIRGLLEAIGGWPG